jgi:RNA recognition motif-containing protein
MPVRLFVGNLSYDATEAELREHFGTIGPVTYCYLPTDRETGRPRGFAFVEYGDDKNAQDAIAQLNNQTFRGRPLAVKEAQPRESRPAPVRGPMAEAVAVLRARSPVVSVARVRPTVARARAASAAVAARHRRQGRASATSVPTRRPRARRRTYTRAPRSAAPRARSARRPTTASTTHSAMRPRTRTPPSTSTISRRASQATSLPINPATNLPTTSKPCEELIS